MIALGYPDAYRAGASSLGLQTVYRQWNRHPRLSCERFFVDPSVRRGGPRTLEGHRPLRDADAVAFSVSCEAELAPLAGLMEAAGLAPLREERNANGPPVIIGGPLTLVDPALVAPFADAVVCGEGEDALPLIADAVVGGPRGRSMVEALHGTGAGIWIPSLDMDPPTLHRVSAGRLPAVGATWSPLSELSNLFLIEIARGCPHRCAFCVLAQKVRYRTAAVEDILAAIPDGAPGVGLVGAAVTDHPRLEELVHRIVSTGRRVSLSSMRADRITPELLAELVKGGLRTLTVAADGSSARLRRQVKKNIEATDLLRCASLAKDAGLRGMKLYSMVGLPGETDGDVEEFAALAAEMAALVPLTVAVQAFVPKPGTPLADEPMAPVRELKSRLDLLARRLGRRAVVQPSSPRWSWIDWKIAHGGRRSALAALAAHRAGGDYHAWKTAVKEFLE